MIFHPSPEAKTLRKKAPAGFGFKLDLTKVNSPEKAPAGTGFKLDLNKIESPEKGPDDDFYEDKSEVEQSTVQEDDIDLNIEEFESRIESIEMSSDYQNIMALLL